MEISVIAIYYLTFFIHPLCGNHGESCAEFFKVCKLSSLSVKKAVRKMWNRCGKLLFFNYYSSSPFISLIRSFISSS